MNMLIVLTAAGVMAMLGGALHYRKVVVPVSLLALACTFMLAVVEWNTEVSYFNSMILLDNYALAFSAVCFLGALFSILFFQAYYRDYDHLPDVISLILFSLIGCVVLASFTNLLMLFLGIEILSLCLYILAGIHKKDLLSNESSLKYFLMGAFSTGFLLMGIALIYAVTGSFELEPIQAFLRRGGISSVMIAGILLVLIGLLFKVSAVPFQFWTPDVYQGAPTVVTGYMATAGKVAAFAALFRLFSTSLSGANAGYELVIALVAAATILIGNITAMYQQSIKRMLAYSSIAHAGYMLLALTALDGAAASALLYYSVAYVLASLPAFIIVQVIQKERGGDQAVHFNGLARQHPALALVLAVSMLSLSGIPVTAGFFGKFYVFSAAVSAGYTWLVAVAVTGSFISIYYYFKPVIAAYLQDSHEMMPPVSRLILSLLLLLSLLTLVTGILPGFLSGLLKS